jgi:hypothetical protein
VVRIVDGNDLCSGFFGGYSFVFSGAFKSERYRLSHWCDNRRGSYGYNIWYV